MKARLVSVLASMTLTAAALSVAAPAQAEPVPEGARAYVTSESVGQNPSDNIVFSGSVGLKHCSVDNDPYDGLCDSVSPVPAGTQVHAVFSSCGNVIREHSEVMDGEWIGLPNGEQWNGFDIYFTPDGTPSMAPNKMNALIGRSLEYTLTITHPGYDPYTLSDSFSGYSVKRPSCEVINSPGYGDEAEPAAINVQSWSTKKGTKTAQVGKRLAVTPTRASGAKVAYAWLVGTTIFDRDRTLTVKKSYRGKKVALRITVSKPGTESVSKWLRYGTTRG